VCAGVAETDGAERLQPICDGCPGEGRVRSRMTYSRPARRGLVIWGRALAVVAVSALALLCVSLAAGCNSSSSASADAATSLGDSSIGSHDAGSEAEAGCITSGPAIDAAPDAWARPSDCGGVGDFCQGVLSCGSQSECQALGNYCVPSAGPMGLGEDCPGTPYCLGFSCMTYEQASCFCTGEGGLGHFPACACGPAAVVGLCAGEGASCATTACCNCQGLKCVSDSVSGTVCRQPCTQNSDCATGCCDTTSGHCHDAIYCSCVDAGAGCGSTGPSCCPGTTCVSFPADASTYNCFIDCTQQDQAQVCPPGTVCSQNTMGLNHGQCVMP
jgi:hypothetical protein